MESIYASELEEGDFLASGRKVVTVEPAEDEWAGERPIGMTPRIRVTFDNADDDYFDTDEEVTIFNRR